MHDADFVVVGNSHAANMLRAYRNAVGPEAPQPPRSTFDFILLTHTSRTDGPGKPDKSDVAWRLDTVRHGLTARRTPSAVISMLFGNHYNSLSFVQHPRAFDVHLPGRPDLGVTAGAQIVPYDLVHRLMASKLMKEGDGLMREMSAALPGTPVVVVPPPPPVPSDDYLQEHGSIVVQEYLRHEVSPLSLRLKFWLINREVLKDAAQRLSLRFLDLPPDVFDRDGFLAESCWRDGVHGNDHFYARLIHLIEETFTPAVPA